MPEPSIGSCRREWRVWRQAPPGRPAARRTICKMTRPRTGTAALGPFLPLTALRVDRYVPEPHPRPLVLAVFLRFEARSARAPAQLELLPTRVPPCQFPPADFAG